MHNTNLWLFHPRNAELEVLKQPRVRPPSQLGRPQLLQKPIERYETMRRRASPPPPLKVERRAIDEDSVPTEHGSILVLKISALSHKGGSVAWAHATTE